MNESTFVFPRGEPWFLAADRKVWRAWLVKNSRVSRCVWLVSTRKDSGKVTVPYDEAVEEALCFGWIDGVVHKLDDQHFARRYTPRQEKSIWSKANVERVERLIARGLMQPAGLRLVDIAKKNGAWQNAYAVGDAVEVPPELKSLLAKNARAQKIFAALTPGQRNSWLRIIGEAKSSATRAQRAADACELIAAGRKAGETDAQAARRGVKSKAEILGR